MDINDSGYYAIFGSLLGFTTISLVLRLYVRRFMTAFGFQLDDYIVIVAWTVLLSIVALLCVLIQHNIARFTAASLADVTFDLKIFFVLPFLHITFLWCVKFAVLVFYNRIFPQPQLKRWILCAAIWLCTTLIGCYLTQIFYCRPIVDNFDPNNFQSVCGESSKTADIIYCILAVLTDIIVMAIPLWLVPKLRISWQKKVALGSIFALGLFAIAASIIRCYIAVTDPQSLTKVLIWGTLEEIVAMVVANAPILRPLVFRGKNFESRTPSCSSTHGTLNSRAGLRDGFSLSPEMANNICIVTSGDGSFEMKSSLPKLVEKKIARSAAPSTMDTFEFLRTVEVMVRSEEIPEPDGKLDDEESAFDSSSWTTP